MEPDSFKALGFWAAVFSREHFWNIVSAGSAAFTALGIFLLPAISRKLRERSVLKMLQAELQEASILMEEIVESWRKRQLVTDGSTGYDFVLSIEATALRLSCERWDNFRFELSSEAFMCLKPFFVTLADIKCPVRALATSNPERLDEFIIARIRYEWSLDFLEQLKKTARLCKYLQY